MSTDKRSPSPVCLSSKALRSKPLNSPRVLLADDSPTVLEALRGMLTPEFEIIGSATDGASLIDLARKLSPDVMILDVFMPGLSGIEVARELKKRHINGCIIFLTVYEDASFVETAKDLGALGYVLKSSADRDLVPAIHEALQGHFYSSSSLH